MSDNGLLREFTASRSESAFTALVRQHVDLVFAAAFRQVGDRSLAEEITQNVFVALAQKAGSLGHHATIAGWLYKATVLECRGVVRAELRRQRREQIAVALGTITPDTDSVWTPLVPLLDEALLQLSEKDRLTVILRFLEEKPLREVGQTLGTSEAAAAKRVARALKHLTEFFRRRGFAVPAVTAGTPLFTVATQAAPAGLAASVSHAALAVTPGVAGGAASTLSQFLHTMAQVKLTTAAVVLISAAVPITVQVAANLQAKSRAAYSNTSPGRGIAANASTLAKDAKEAAGAATRHIVNGLDLDLLARQFAKLPTPPDEPELEVQLRRLMFTLDQEQVRAVAGLFGQAKHGEVLQPVAEALLSRWAELNPREAVLAAQNLPVALAANSLVGALKTWASADPDAALRWLAAAQQLDLKDIHYSVVFRQLARNDPRDAASRALRVEDSALRRSAALAALEVWSQSAPEDALAWAEAREAEAQKNEYAAKVLDSVKRLSPQRAIDLSLRAQNPHVRTDGILYALVKWCSVDPVAAAQAFLALPERDRNEEVILRQITAYVATVSLEQAAGLALPSAERPAGRSSLQGLVWRWHKQDPAAVERWIAELPDSGGKKVAAEALAFAKRAGGNKK